MYTLHTNHALNAPLVHTTFVILRLLEQSQQIVCSHNNKQALMHRPTSKLDGVFVITPYQYIVNVLSMLV
jgi:hypothetical protein